MDLLQAAVCIRSEENRSKSCGMKGPSQVVDAEKVLLTDDVDRMTGSANNFIAQSANSPRAAAYALGKLSPPRLVSAVSDDPQSSPGESSKEDSSPRPTDTTYDDQIATNLALLKSSIMNEHNVSMMAPSSLIPHEIATDAIPWTPWELELATLLVDACIGPDQYDWQLVRSNACKPLRIYLSSFVHEYCSLLYLIGPSLSVRRMQFTDLLEGLQDARTKYVNE